MQDLMIQFVTWLLAHNPVIASILVFMGTARLIFKPVMSAIQQVVEITSTKEDDKILSQVMSSPAYKAVVWVLDWVASVKLPKKEEK